MAELRVDDVIKVLKGENFSDEQAEKVRKAITDNLPSETYNTAAHYLGLVTLMLVVSALLLTLFGKTVSEQLWTVAGAGIGGLAGIFVGKK